MNFIRMFFAIGLFISASDGEVRLASMPSMNPLRDSVMVFTIKAAAVLLALSAIKWNKKKEDSC
jgi:uncharacterized ion transporter superfamily protein YfcC